MQLWPYFVLPAAVLIWSWLGAHTQQTSLEPATTTTTTRSDQAEKNMTATALPYDQFILFGDSLFQHSTDQSRGFGLQPALQSGRGLSTKPEER